MVNTNSTSDKGKTEDGKTNTTVTPNQGTQTTGSNPRVPDANMDQLGKGYELDPANGSVTKTNGEPNGVFENQKAQAASEQAGVINTTGKDPAKPNDQD